MLTAYDMFSWYKYQPFPDLCLLVLFVCAKLNRTSQGKTPLTGKVSFIFFFRKKKKNENFVLFPLAEGENF